MKVYLAGPLFNEMERERNAALASVIENMGWSVFLPQRDGGLATTMIATDPERENEIRKSIFEADIAALDNSEVLLCLLDGRVPDEGTMFELGYAYAHGKKCIALKTDCRAMDSQGRDNIMVEHSVLQCFGNTFELLTYLVEMAQQ